MSCFLGFLGTMGGNATVLSRALHASLSPVSILINKKVSKLEAKHWNGPDTIKGSSEEHWWAVRHELSSDSVFVRSRHLPFPGNKHPLLCWVRKGRKLLPVVVVYWRCTWSLYRIKGTSLSRVPWGVSCFYLQRQQAPCPEWSKQLSLCHPSHPKLLQISVFLKLQCKAVRGTPWYGTGEKERESSVWWTGLDYNHRGLFYLSNHTLTEIVCFMCSLVALLLAFPLRFSEHSALQNGRSAGVPPAFSCWFHLPIKNAANLIFSFLILFLFLLVFFLVCACAKLQCERVEYDAVFIFSLRTAFILPPFSSKVADTVLPILI